MNVINKDYVNNPVNRCERDYFPKEIVCHFSEKGLYIALDFVRFLQYIRPAVAAISYLDVRYIDMVVVKYN